MTGLLLAFLAVVKVFHAREGRLVCMMTQQPDFEVRDLIGQCKDSVPSCLRHGKAYLKSQVETISYRPEFFSDSVHFTGVYERDDGVLDVSHVVCHFLSKVIRDSEEKRAFFGIGPNLLNPHGFSFPQVGVCGCRTIISFNYNNFHNLTPVKLRFLTTNLPDWEGSTYPQPRGHCVWHAAGFGFGTALLKHMTAYPYKTTRDGLFVFPWSDLRDRLFIGLWEIPLSVV